MARTWFEKFKLDSGEEIEIEWSWQDNEYVQVEEIIDGPPGVLELTDNEYTRFHEQCVSLKPFPPHEEDHDLD